MGYTLLYNTLDNPQNPNEGAYINFSQDFAGLGGDVKFIRTTIDGRYYYPLTSDFTLMLRGQAGNVYGWGSTPLNIFDHFFKGPEIVRGFQTAGIGPRDLGSRDPGCARRFALLGRHRGNPVPAQLHPEGFRIARGGVRRCRLAVELQGRDDHSRRAGILRRMCPVRVQTMPSGNVCVADSGLIRTSVGASLIWASPFGPLRFDYAFALTKEPWDKLQAFRFGGMSRF